MAVRDATISNMHDDFLKPYNPHVTEPQIYAYWEESGFFNPDNLPGKRTEPFVISLPPPNVTGTLHLGHALNAVIQDILIRYKRMRGFRTLWVPGTDHAGIATQNVVEKELKKQGITRHQLGREKFLEKVWEWKEKYGGIILDQLKKLGASCDWSRTRFTMDEGYTKAVGQAFLHYHTKGWIYRGDRIVNWCIRCATSLSDLELEYRQEKGKLWHIKYPLKDGGFITVATTRPESMLGDAAVAVNPKDKRYKDLVGKIAILPILNREIPIVGDEAVEMDFGTGAVKVTPAHDFTDTEIAQRHNLESFQVINEKGKMTALAGDDFVELSIAQCRARVVEKLKALGFLEKEEDYAHSVAHCYRCDTVIEPLISKQWFLKMDKLAEHAISAVKKGKVKFYPARWEKVYLDWLSKVKDWCISRQIWWGHKIPIEGSEDVLDTWFSSALWPFATLGWPSACGEVKSQKSKVKSCEPKEGSDLEKYYPTSVLSTDRGIINLWVARMIFSGIELTGDMPFSDVIIHATVLAKDGRRMSKSLGTGVDPMTLVEKYGADAIRFGLIWQAMGGQDIKWADEHVVAGQKFANKLWNIARFILSKSGGDFSFELPAASDAEGKKILAQLEETAAAAQKQIESYEFGQALHDIYEFVWREFADKYIEYSKNKEDTETKQTLSYSLFRILKLLHPFTPFVTEAIYQHLPKKDKEFLMVEHW